MLCHVAAIYEETIVEVPLSFGRRYTSIAKYINTWPGGRCLQYACLRSTVKSSCKILMGTRGIFYVRMLMEVSINIIIQ